MSRDEIETRMRGVDMLLRKIAWSVWRGLPQHVRVVVDVDDLLQEARLALWERAHRWDPGRGAWTTFTQRVATSYLLNVRERLCAQKRDPGSTVNEEAADYVQDLRSPADLPVVDSVIAAWYRRAN